MIYEGPERRQRLTLKQSFIHNPGMVILLAFNVLMTSLILMSLMLERNFTIAEAQRRKIMLVQTNKQLLYFCEQIELHRFASHQFFLVTADEHGYMYPVPQIADPPDTLEESRKRCDRFRLPPEETKKKKGR